MNVEKGVENHINQPILPNIEALRIKEITETLQESVYENLDIRDGKPYLLGEKSQETINNLTELVLGFTDLGVVELNYISDQFAINLSRDNKLPPELRKTKLEDFAIAQVFKNAAGIRALEIIDSPVEITVIVPTYAEGDRANPYDPENNPNGQNSVHYTLLQLERLSAANQNVKIKLVYLSDGDKKGSREVIEPRLKLNNLRGTVKAEYVELHDLINEPDSEYKIALGNIDNPTKQSRKGGAAKAGLIYSNKDTDTEEKGNKSIKLTILTDADLEMDCRQFGRGILAAVQHEDLQAVSMSRRHEASTQIKSKVGDLRGKIFIALRRALTGSSINDSQQTLILKQPMAAEMVTSFMSNRASNEASYPATLLGHIEREKGLSSVVEIPAQFNADGGASNFDSSAYSSILASTSKAYAEYYPDENIAKVAKAIITWIETNPDSFTEKVQAMGADDFDFSNLRVLQREPAEKHPSLRELVEIAKYLGIDIDFIRNNA